MSSNPTSPKRSTAGLLWRLLVAGAIVPIVSETAIVLGQRAGFYGADWASVLNVLLVSGAFIALVLVERASIHRLCVLQYDSVEALRQTEARHRELIDQLPHFIFSVDNEDRYTAANAATCRFFGRDETEIIGRSALELGVPEELARKWSEQKARTRKTGVTQTLDLTIPLEHGLGQFRAITHPVRDQSGNVVGVGGISIDLTDLRTAEAAARRMLNAVEQLDEAVFITDRNGAINYINPAFARLYGYTSEEVIGQTPRILKSGEHARQEYEAFWRELLKGSSVRTEFHNRTKSGSIVVVAASVSPIIDADGSISGFIAVHDDVTEQRSAQEAKSRFEERVAHLARMEALGTLAGGMAHDFNNILSIILTHTSLLERRAEDPSVVARVTSTIQQAVKRGAALTRQILTFARRAEIKLEDVDLAKLILELGSMIGETFPRTINVTLDLDPDLPLVRADAGQLHQAILNLCVNARDSMPNGGDLTIAAYVKTAALMKERVSGAHEEYIEISVRDTGTGIDEETQRRLFEPFFTTKERGKGTGLGLAVVFGVVNHHGGSVDVESRLGQGTTFRLYLPLTRSEAELPAEKIEFVGGTERLFVIEDEPALRESVSTQLRAHGYRVETASNGVEALEQLRRRSDPLPDAVVMDLGMPHMSALDLVHGLLELEPRLPIMAMTGYVDPQVHAGVVAAGIRRVVAKPFRIHELLTAVRDTLRER